jgi:tetratricopeptide (TPR) repeat protein
MGKPTAKRPPAAEGDTDEQVFLELSRELKEEASRLFNRKDYEGAAFNYHKAIQLLPNGRIEAAHLRSSVAQCYMRMVPGEYHRAIHECNLALEVAPRYSRALLRRASCFQALDRPDLAWGDVVKVLGWEPGNRAAREISETVKAALKEKGVVVSDPVVDGNHVGGIKNGLEKEEEKKLRNEHTKQENHVEDKQYRQENHTEHKEANGTRNHQKLMGDKETNGLEMEQNDAGGKQGKHISGQHIGRAKSKGRKHSAVKPVDHVRENRHNIMDSNMSSAKTEAMRDLKLVFGEDIRCAQWPADGSLSQLREIVQNKFPSLKAFLIKYKDKEDDLVTITSSEELRWANNLADPEVPIRLYVAEVDPVQELGVDAVSAQPSSATLEKNRYSMAENGSTRRDNEHNCYVDDWVLQFARLFKTHVGFDCDAYLDLHDLGMRLYCDAMEDTVASEEAQEMFQAAELKFQEMAALALFNWGNISMSRARKRPLLSEDGSIELILEQVKTAYEWACSGYTKAGSKYEEAVKTKPDFFEGLIALGQQKFEQAKLSWYYALACKIDMGTKVLGLFNDAEDNMEKGMELWEGMENMRLRGLSKPNKESSMLEKMALEGYMKVMSADEAFEQASSIRSHINILWGTILYERSVVEFKLGLPSWEESLTVAMEKFKTGGASSADISVMVKNHCANETTQEGKDFISFS